jgi:hypothetical protein
VEVTRQELEQAASATAEGLMEGGIELDPAVLRRVIMEVHAVQQELASRRIGSAPARALRVSDDLAAAGLAVGGHDALTRLQMKRQQEGRPGSWSRRDAEAVMVGIESGIEVAAALLRINSRARHKGCD